MKKFLRKYIWLFLIISLIILFPQSLSNQAELNMRMIITGIGIDYKDDKYTLTSQIVLPSSKNETSSINAHLSQVETTGETISAAIQDLSFKLGKIPEFSHLEYVLIGKSLEKQNIVGCLDYFFRNFKLKNSIMLFSAEEDASETIKSISKLELSVALNMQKLFLSSEQNTQGIAKTYVEFTSDSFSKSGVSVIDTLSFNKEESQESSSSSKDSAEKPSTIKLMSSLKLYKKGVLSGKIENKDQIFGYHLLNNKSISSNLSLKNFSYGDIQNANINLRLDRISKKITTKFDSNKPTFNITLVINECHIDEIACDGINKNIYSSILPYKSQDEILNAAKDKLRENITECFLTAQSQNCDIYQLANYAHITDSKKWQTYLNQLANEDEYIKTLNINVNIEFDNVK